MLKKLTIVVLILLLLASCSTAASVAPSRTNSDMGLGNELIFERGWQLHSFTCASQYCGTFAYVCVSVDTITPQYRFCTPEIIER